MDHLENSSSKNCELVYKTDLRKLSKMQQKKIKKLKVRDSNIEE